MAAGGYFGDYVANATVRMGFDSFAAATGASSATTNFAAADVKIYKDGGSTPRSSANGITVAADFNSLTGINTVNIDLSDNTDSGFYATGHEYMVAVADVTIDGQTVRFILGFFSIQRSGWANMIADAFLDRDMSIGTDSGSSTVRTVRQALRLSRNKWVVSGTTLTVYKENDSTSSWTSSLTGTSGADPVTGSDPTGP